MMVRTVRERILHHKLVIASWILLIAVGFSTTLWQFWLTSQNSSVISIFQPDLPLEILAIDTEPVATVSAKYYWIYDRNSKQVLISKEANQATAPASLVKLMTALIAFEQYDLNDVVQVGSASAVIGNKAKFYSQDKFKVSDLMRAMLLFSANDAAQALAYGTGNYDQFVQAMNDKAQQLELPATHFSNPTGLDNGSQSISAEDLGKIADQVISVPALADIVASSKAVITEQQTGRQDVIYSTNDLLRRGPQFKGVKTGTTDLAGENLITRYVETWNLLNLNQNQVTDQDLDLILVVMGSQDRYKDTLTLIDWLHQHLQIVKNPLR